MNQSMILNVILLCGFILNQIGMVNAAATQFTLPKDDVIVCSDSLDNVCTAPTSCSKFGKVAFDQGNNFNVGSAENDNGVWRITGGYTIDFPSVCNVTCQGNCTCKTCTTIEVDDLIATADGATTTSSAYSIGTLIAFFITTVAYVTIL